MKIFINLDEESTWPHDCDECEYLGYFRIVEDIYDVYYCPTHQDLVARFGAEDHEYLSWKLAHTSGKGHPPMKLSKLIYQLKKEK